MERQEAVEQLPVTYQRVLAWLGEGRSHEQIAAELGIDSGAVGPLLRLAEAKLARLTGDSPAVVVPVNDGSSRGREA